jgi:hypothetical protein
MTAMADVKIPKMATTAGIINTIFIMSSNSCHILGNLWERHSENE